MSGRILRNVVCGLALVAVCTLLVPPPAQAADLRGAGGLVPGWSWNWLGSLWSEVGSALNSFFGENEETPAPVSRTWDKQGTGVDPNGPPALEGGASLVTITICDSAPESCAPVAGR